MFINKVRHWVYKLGFRPKHGSIFYSPSRAFTAAIKQIGKKK